MLKEHRRIDQHQDLGLPFGYYLEFDSDLLTLRRPDGSFVAAFSTRGVDLLEIELTLWEDAD